MIISRLVLKNWRNFRSADVTFTERVFIIGPGHVGRGLFRAFRASGVEVVGLHGKRPSGVATSTGSIPPDIARANVVILCVRDPQLDETVEEVIAAAKDGRIQRDTAILHTSAIESVTR